MKSQTSMWIGVIVTLLVGIERTGVAQNLKPGEQHGWKAVSRGVQVAKLWRTADSDQPQVAMLQLSSDQQSEFTKNPTAFLNKHKIFPAAVSLATVNVTKADTDKRLVSVAAAR